MKYSVKYKLTSLDIAPNGGVRPASLLRYFQEAINLQMYDNPPSTEELFAAGQAFILSRTSMHIYTKLSVYDEITVTTWANTSKGATFVRSAQIFLGDTLAADIITLWALVDMNEHKLVRVKDAKLGLSTLDELPSIPLPEKIRIPDGEMKKVGERQVFYSDIDRNDHMNNTRYIDMICDFIPDLENKTVRSFTVNYLSESKLGEALSIYHTDNGENDYFRALKSDGTTSVEIMLRLEDVEK
jgi:acyl-ACP thioesterase